MGFFIHLDYKKMNNKILKNLVIGIAIFGAVISIGLTVSYFQDAEKSENNVFSAGTLDLNLEKAGGGEANAVWQAENWLPGDETEEGELEFTNEGSIPIESLIMEVEIE